MSRSQDRRDQTDPSEPLPTVERTSPCVADADAVPALTRPLDRLVAVRAPTLAPLERWSASGSGAVLVHRVPAGAVPLDTLRREGPLRAGHVLTVALAITDALVALHEAGLAHGAVDVAHVLVAPDGSVRLAGAGLAWWAAPGLLGGPTPEGDVAAVGDLVRHLIGRGGAPGSLVLATLRACDADPALRPDSVALAALLRSCGRPESLLDALWHQPDAPLPPPTPAPAMARPTGAPPRPGAPRPLPAAADSPAEVASVPSQSRAPRTPRPPTSPRSARRGPAVSLRTIATVVLVATLGLGAVRAVTVVAARADEPGPTGSASTTTALAEPTGGPDAGASTPAATTSAAPIGLDPVGEQVAVDWAGVLAALDAGRRTALASGSTDELARWVDPAGAAWRGDSDLLRRLADSASRITGGELVLEEVRPLRAEADRVLLAVRDRRTAYDVVQDGTTTHVPERAAAWWTVTLTPLPALDGEGWRIAEVRGREDRAAG